MRLISCAALGVVALAGVLSTGCAGGQNVFTLQRENQQLKTELAAAQDEVRQAEQACGALRGNLEEHIRTLAVARLEEGIARSLLSQVNDRQRRAARYQTVNRAPDAPDAVATERIRTLENQVNQLQQQLRNTPAGTTRGHWNAGQPERTGQAGQASPRTGTTGACPQGTMTATNTPYTGSDQPAPPARKTKKMVLEQNRGSKNRDAVKSPRPA